MLLERECLLSKLLNEVILVHLRCKNRNIMRFVVSAKASNYSSK